MNYKLIFRLLFELIISIAGYTLITCYGNGWIAFGVFLTMWGNNMGIIRRINKATGSI
jgi:hypothetical protein